jgi:hypothetical protein
LTKRSRGKQPNDDKLFAAEWHPIFTEAVDDFCHLLSRGYADNSIAQIVGNRYKLNKRQRDAIRRISSSDQEISRRQQKCCPPKDLKNRIVEIDGFNLLILLESALSGGYVFKARDGTYRDISSVHGSYKRVQKTEEAILLVGNTLRQLGVKSVKWYFDQPVSNSGKLKTRLLEISRENDFKWEVELVFDPDKVLVQSEKIVITADGLIIDQASKWFNLSAFLIENYLSDANVITV